MSEGTINVNMATCKVCGKLVEKIEYRGKYYNLRRQRWNGSTCPTCNVELTNMNMKKIRSERKSDMEDEWSNYDAKTV